MPRQHLYSSAICRVHGMSASVLLLMLVWHNGSIFLYYLLISVFPVVQTQCHASICTVAPSAGPMARQHQFYCSCWRAIKLIISIIMVSTDVLLTWNLSFMWYSCNYNSMTMPRRYLYSSPWYQQCHASLWLIYYWFTVAVIVWCHASIWIVAPSAGCMARQHQFCCSCWRGIELIISIIMVSTDVLLTWNLSLHNASPASAQ